MFNLSSSRLIFAVIATVVAVTAIVSNALFLLLLSFALVGFLPFINVNQNDTKQPCKALLSSTSDSFDTPNIKQLTPFGSKQNTGDTFQSMLALTLDSLTDAVIRLDANQNIMYVNTATLSLLACDVEDIVGANYHKIMMRYIDNSPELKLVQTEPPKTAKLTLKVKHRSLTIEQVCTHHLDNTKQEGGCVVVLRDITRAEKLRQRLRYQANYDPVTQLFNRYKFEQSLADAWHNAKQNGETHALIQLDMDRFKLINDNAGHAAGDQLLREIGQLLKKQLRQSDVCARVGGDEFAILLIGVDELSVIKVLEKLNNALKNYQFNHMGQSFPTGASIGATLISQESPELVDVKREADTACFIAKNKGINHVKLFDRQDDFLAEHQEAPRWAAKIDGAINGDSFELYYQPIEQINDYGNKKHHIEILLRLNDNGNILSPAVFLPAAERFRLSTKVDSWVVENVFAWIEATVGIWHNTVVGINLSAESLTDEDFVDSIIQAKARVKFPAQCVCFEITESAAVSNLSVANHMIAKLRQLGFSIALDDFGRGFSTYSYMKSFSADFIKIDGSFIKEMINDKRDVEIVRSIHQVSSAMGMKTIAEFVENQETLKLLKQMGVDYVQGYAIAEPRPIHEFLTVRQQLKVC